MARRRKTSTLDDLLNIAMKMPLWANLVIAGGSFALLRYYAGSSLPVMQHAATGELAQAYVDYFLKLIAYLGQFFIPAVFVLGGILGWLQRSIRAYKFKSISRAKEPGMALRDLTWEQFERMVGEAFRRQGYRVEETAKGPDGGVDLELRRGGELFLVQCKQWKAAKVSVQVVRELFGVMSSRGAAGGFVVTSGVFTKDAWAFARGTSVVLVDGARLVEMFKPSAAEEQAQRSGGPAPAGNPTIGETASVMTVEAVVEHSAHSSDTEQLMACPRCGGKMTPRYARAKNNGIANNVFLGCLNFPTCRGTRQLDGWSRQSEKVNRA